MIPSPRRNLNKTVSINGKAYEWKRFVQDAMGVSIIDKFDKETIITEINFSKTPVANDIVAWIYANKLSNDYWCYLLELKEYIE